MYSIGYYEQEDDWDCYETVCYVSRFPETDREYTKIMNKLGLTREQVETLFSGDCVLDLKEVNGFESGYAICSVNCLYND